MASSKISPLFSSFTSRDLAWLSVQWNLSLLYPSYPLNFRLPTDQQFPLGLPRPWGERSLDGSDQAFWQTKSAATNSGFTTAVDLHSDSRYLSGSTGTLFRRLFDLKGNFTSQTGGFKLNHATGEVFFDEDYRIDYSQRGTTLYDARPRLLSNLISSERDVPLLEVLDNPYTNEWTQSGTAQGRRVSQSNNTHHETILNGQNPLPNSGYLALFGQYNDHGFDFLDKGKDGSVVIPILPGDELYKPGSPTNFMVLSRGNTIRLMIGDGSSDDLVKELGLKEGILDSNADGDGKASTWNVNLDNSYTGSQFQTPSKDGTLLLNDQIINIAKNSNLAAVITQINAVSALTGVLASEAGGKLKLNPRSGESVNHTSAFVDLNQTYGSNLSMAVFLREYDSTGKPTGRMLEGKDGGIARWSDIKANARKIGLTLHDRDVTRIPLVEKITGSPDRYGFVVLDKTTGAKSYAFDTASQEIIKGVQVLVDSGQAFLMDLAHGWNAKGFDGQGDLINPNPGQPTLLDLHAAGGDGRLNENIGLTSLHEVFVKTHNAIFEQVDKQAAGSTSVEEKFESARLITLNFYQHHVFQEYVRRITPNVGAFAGSRTDFNPGIMAEFASAVFRFGHSQLRPDMAMKAVGPNGIATNAAKKDSPLLEVFLAPYRYGKETAQQIAAGMTKQVGAATDEYITDTLRNSLVGLPLDLGALNNGRGWDAGLITLNMARLEIQKWIIQNSSSNNANAGGLDARLRVLLPTQRPYVSWKDFGEHLLHPQSLKGFIAAYARDDVLLRYGRFPGMQSRLFRSEKARLAYWNRLQTSKDPRDCRRYQAALEAAVQAALRDPSFMGQSFNPNGATSIWKADGTKNELFQPNSGNQKFQEISLWLGGLAEAKAKGSMLGPVHDFIYAYQMQGLQRGDESYYLAHLGRTDLLAEIQGKVLVDMVMAATGLRHMYHKLFAVNDADYELSDPGCSRYDSIDKLRQANRLATDCNGNVQNLGAAGFVGGEFYGNQGNYLDARGALNPNGAGNASEMFGGTEGNDTIHGGGGDDAIWGDGGADVLFGDAGNDFIDAGSGNDKVFGGIGSDLLRGGEGADEVWGSGGGDGSALEDLSSDDMYGGDGNDSLHGGGGDDDLNGLGDDDQLWGDGGDDAVKGQSGNDSLHGGEGNDNLTGGDGADWFYFDTTPNGTIGDTITDFQVGVDKLVFLTSPFTGLTTGPIGDQFSSTLTDPSGNANGTAATRLIYNSTNGKLFYDADGSGSGASALLVATLAKFNPALPADNASNLAVFPNLTASDVIVI